MDLSDRDVIVNFNKKFTFISDDDLYPSYKYIQQQINYLMLLYQYKENNVKYVFENNNPFDLRKCNVKCYHTYHNVINEKYNVVKYIPGHCSKNGVEPYNMKNPIWKITEKENEKEKEYLLMYCETDTIVKLCPISYQKILDYEVQNNNGKKITFFKQSNNYIRPFNISNADK